MDQYTVVAANGQEYGPCDLATLQQWIREGRIVASTPIRKNGAIAVSAEFLPETASEFRSAAPPPVPPPPPAPAAATPPLPPMPRTPLTPGGGAGGGGWVPPTSSGGAAGAGGPRQQAPAPTEFRVWGIIGQAWELVRPHMVPLGVMCALPILPGFIPIIGGIASAVLIGPAFIATYRAILGMIDGEAPRVDMLFKIDDRFGQGLLAYLTIAVLSTIGFVLCIVPGVILTVMWSLTFVRLADTSTEDFWAAMKRSAELTKGYRLKIWLMFLSFIPLMLLGMLAFCVGIFVTMAVSYTSFALVYRFLVAQEAARQGATGA